MNTSDVTAVIPLRIDSPSRLKNVQSTIVFLLKFFDFKIIVKECDKTQNLFLPKNNRIKYIFEFDNNEYFYRTKILNEMLLMVDTKYTVNYDCDILLPQKNCYKTLELLNSGHDLVYPYKKGTFLGEWNFSDEDIGKILSYENTSFLYNLINKYQLKGFHPGLDVFDKLNLGTIYTTGGIQFFNTKSYINGFGENELFIDWGPEDQERLYRFYTLGYKIGWIDDGLVCHMSHAKSKSTDENYFYNKKNHELYNHIVNNFKTKEQMLNYMQSLEYTQKLNKNVAFR